MGPCRLPLPKSGIEGEDTRKGLCGATPNTIAARNFARMVAAGAASHSDHGRCVAEVFLAAARKETNDYQIKDVAEGVRYRTATTTPIVNYSFSGFIAGITHPFYDLIELTCFNE